MLLYLEKFSSYVRPYSARPYSASDSEPIAAEKGMEIDSSDEKQLESNATRGVGKTGVTPQALALPEGTGSIQGMGESFSANLNTGSGTFSVPIGLPSGRRGVQPSIGLAYSTGVGKTLREITKLDEKGDVSCLLPFCVC